MGAQVRRDLYLQVSGDVGPLSTAMKAGRTALLSLGNAAVDVQAEVDKALAEMSANAPAQAKQLERSYTATFNAIRQNAKAVLEAPSSGAALQVLDAGAAETAARAAETQAAALRQVATAAAAVATRAGEAGEAERVLAIATAANATQAEQEATALRNQANVIGQVRGELQTMGIVQGKQVTVNGQAKAGYQQLSYQLGDIATQYASGASASLIFAQQSGQVIQAISLISGESKGLIGLLGGPWGIAFSSALVVATPWVAKLLEGGDALAKETAELKKNAEHAAIADEAKQAFLRTEAGAIDDVRALTEELKKQNDELKTNAERLNIRAKNRLETLAGAKDDVTAQLAEARRGVDEARISEGAGATGAVSAAMSKVTELETRLKSIDKAIAAANAARLQTQKDLAEEAAKRLTDPLERIKNKYEGDDGLIQQAKNQATAEEVINGTLTRRLALLDRQQRKETEAAQAAQRAASRTGNNNQIGRQVTVAEATQIAASIGGRVTSGLRSTERQAQLYQDHLEGRHAGPVAKPGTSDHERGQAIDIAYGPGITVAKIREAFAKEGVAIRQLLDERDQKVFHVAFGPKGKSQEAVDRQAEAEEQKRIRNAEAYAQLKNRAEQDLVDETRRRTTGISAAADLDVKAIELERDRQVSAAQAGVAEKRWTQEQADAVKLLAGTTAGLRIAGVREQERNALAQRALEIQRDDIEGQLQLLNLQADLATTNKDRRAIALKILELQEREAKAILQRAIDAEKDPERKADLQRQLGRVEPEFALKRQAANDNTAGSLDRYRKQLHDATDDMNGALEGVAVHGLQTLEDGFVGIIDGTESVSSAFKKMASAIIADLARIAIEKAIVKAIGGSFLGFSDGGLVTAQRHATGGLISGPGSGTSDDILSWLSNGEFVMTAKATRKYLPVLRAMNDNHLPAFATGGLVGNMSLPRLPDVRAAANDVYGSRADRLKVDVHTTVEASPEFDAKVQGVAIRTVGAAAEPIMAGAQVRTIKQLRRPSLPGGLG